MAVGARATLFLAYLNMPYNRRCGSIVPPFQGQYPPEVRLRSTPCHHPVRSDTLHPPHPTPPHHTTITAGSHTASQKYTSITVHSVLSDSWLHRLPQDHRQATQECHQGHRAAPHHRRRRVLEGRGANGQLVVVVVVLIVSEGLAWVPEYDHKRARGGEGRWWWGV